VLFCGTWEAFEALFCVLFCAVNFFWRQSEGGTDSGWCISGGNHCHSLRKRLCRQKKFTDSVYFMKAGAHSEVVLDVTSNLYLFDTYEKVTCVILKDYIV
jgi:hypothetical protein